ncbi:MAG: U32 family peptidase [Actinobacteria bacterium]|nr:U32 family peptidase [Actinomycetota bacterium]
MSHKTHWRPELLAPVGDPTSLRAAINNGADAVYLGLDRFNARLGAQNFSAEELSEAIDLAHLHGVRVYITANVVILPDEMASALALVDEIWSMGADAIIVQDLGLASVIKSELEDVRLHASTQIGAHNTPTIAELGRAGFSRVTLAREMALGQVSRLVASTDLEVEIFAHGALCVCYSGQCLMSSMIGGRSANRGRCAQPCRLTYQLEDAKSRKARSPGAHLLSTKDLSTIEMLPDLIATGVSSLKIEGRMKAPEYVALVTGVYRRALDRAIADPEGFEVSAAEKSILAEAFSRGFSSAYLTGIRDNTMMSFTRPNNRGIPIGRVGQVRAGRTQIKLDVAMDIGDTVEVWTGRGRHVAKIGSIEIAGQQATTAPAGSSPFVDIGASVSQGDRVFRVVNAALQRAARRTFTKTDGTFGPLVDFRVKALTGHPLHVSATHGSIEVAVEGPVVERARTKPITPAEITEHVGRLGGTPFRLGSVSVDLSAEAGLGYSALHRVRREALDALKVSLLKPWEGRQRIFPAVLNPSRTRPKSDVPQIVVWTTSPTVAKACLQAGANRVIMAGTQDHAVTRQISSAALELPRIAHDEEIADILDLAAEYPSVVAGNLGLIPILSQRSVSVEAHWSLNATNAHSVAALAKSGASFAWLSPELSGRQIASIAHNATIPVGISVYGYQEVMITEHCVLMSIGDCSKRCHSCRRREERYFLKDAKGYSFPAITDATGRTRIYNSVPLDLTRAIPEIIQAGVDAVRLDFIHENAQRAERITAHFREMLIEGFSGRSKAHASKLPHLAENSTSGQFFRGIG